MKTILALTILAALVTLILSGMSMKTLRDTDRRAETEVYRQHFAPLFPDGEKLDSVLTDQYNSKNLPLQFEIGGGE